MFMVEVDDNTKAGSWTAWTASSARVIEIRPSHSLRFQLHFNLTS